MIKLHGIYKQNPSGSGLRCFGRHQLKLLGALPHCVLFLSDLVTSVVGISGNKLRGMLLHAKRHSLPVRTRKAPLWYLSTPKLKSRFHSGTGTGLFIGPAWVLLDPSKAAWVQPWKTEKKKLLPHKESRKKMSQSPIPLCGHWSAGSDSSSVLNHPGVQSQPVLPTPLFRQAPKIIESVLSQEYHGAPISPLAFFFFFFYPVSSSGFFCTPFFTYFFSLALFYPLPP